MQNTASKLSSILKAIAKPILEQLPFFVFTFIMWTPCCFLEFRDAFRESAWRPATNIAIMRYLGLATFYSYCFTTIIYLAKHKAVKISGYVISLIFFYIYWALRKVFFTDITPQIMLLAVETNTDEASEFLNNYITARGNISALIITFGMIAGIILAEWFYPRVKSALSQKNT